MTAEDAPAPAPDRNNLALMVLAVAGCVFLLRYAWEILLPIMIAILASYALNPVVKWIRSAPRPPPRPEVARPAPDSSRPGRGSRHPLSLRGVALWRRGAERRRARDRRRSP